MDAPRHETTGIPASGRQLELRAGDQRVVVTQVGASVREYEVAGEPVLWGPAADELATHAQGQALIPWPNRLQDGSYEFRGATHQVPLTEPGKGNAIHGFARWQAFTVIEHSGDRAVLSLLLYPRAGYPFVLEVEVAHELDADEGLTVRTTARNAGRAPLPYGSGFHPYLTVGTDTIDTALLRIPAEATLELDDRGIPTGREVEVAGTDRDFRSLREIGDVELDVPFTRLIRDDDGRARLRLEAPGGRGVTLWVDEAHPHLMAFTGDTLPDPDERRRALGAEPMTCPPNAFRTGEHVRVLEPGEETGSAWGIAPR